MITSKNRLLPSRDTGFQKSNQTYRDGRETGQRNVAHLCGHATNLFGHKAGPCCKNEHWGLAREQLGVAVQTARVRRDFDVFDRSLSLEKAPLCFLPSQDAFKEPCSGGGVHWIWGAYEQMGCIVKKMKEEPV